MSENKAMLPRLRFPEFRDAGPWEEKPLAKLVSTVTPPKKLQTAAYETSGSYPIIDQSQDFICGWTNDEAAIIQEGFPLIVFGDHTCVLKRVDQPFAQGADGIKILDTNPEITVDFLFQFLHAVPLEMKGYRRHFSLLKEKKVIFPDIETGEQQKIAACLSSLDDLITVQGQKVAALERHKKGLMQQLFPATNQTTPALRFPEFREAGAWEERPLAKLVSTITPPKKLQTADYKISGKYPIIDQSQDFICGWTNDEAAIIQEGFPFIVFGDHTCVLKRVDQPFAQGADGIKILDTTAEITTDFLFQFLHAVPLEMKGYRRHFSLLKEKAIIFPDVDTGEQQKIAACLTSVDDLIRAEGQKLAALERHKKGLMQQLFPNSDEGVA